MPPAYSIITATLSGNRGAGAMLKTADGRLLEGSEGLRSISEPCLLPLALLKAPFDMGVRRHMNVKASADRPVAALLTPSLGADLA